MDAITLTEDEAKERIAKLGNTYKKLLSPDDINKLTGMARSGMSSPLLDHLDSLLVEYVFMRTEQLYCRYQTKQLDVGFATWMQSQRYSPLRLSEFWWEFRDLGFSQDFWFPDFKPASIPADAPNALDQLRTLFAPRVKELEKKVNRRFANSEAPYLQAIELTFTVVSYGETPGITATLKS